jgi:hypothetical protein
VSEQGAKLILLSSPASGVDMVIELAAASLSDTNRVISILKNTMPSFWSFTLTGRQTNTRSEVSRIVKAPRACRIGYLRSRVSSRRRKDSSHDFLQYRHS